MQVGDLVTRISYKHDIIFEINDIKTEVMLKGVFERIYANSPVEDLIIVKKEALETKKKKELNQREAIKNDIKKTKKYVTGKILHIDGDKLYLDKCLEFYKLVGCYANGAYVEEHKMSQSILMLIERYNPDIIVITGHDSYNKKGIKPLENYKNSTNFINTVKKIRSRYSRDDKFIIAGACQSHFEAIIAAGANFAMSPKRVNVHLFDPAIIAIKASFTPFNEIVSLEDIIRFSYIKRDGIGGVESYGKMRILL